MWKAYWRRRRPRAPGRSLQGTLHRTRPRRRGRPGRLDPGPRHGRPRPVGGRGLPRLRPQFRQRGGRREGGEEGGEEGAPGGEEKAAAAAGGAGGGGGGGDDDGDDAGTDGDSRGENSWDLPSDSDGEDDDGGGDGGAGGRGATPVYLRKLEQILLKGCERWCSWRRDGCTSWSRW